MTPLWIAWWRRNRSWTSLSARPFALDLGEAAGAVGEGDDRPQPLDAVHHVGVDLAELAAQLGREPLERPAGRATGSAPTSDQERQQHQRQRPADEGQRDQHAARHQHRHEGRRDGVGEEVLDHLDVAESRR